MTFEHKTPDDLVRIAGAGGGFTMAGGIRTTDQLVRIAMAAKSGGAQITITGITRTRTTDDLVRISMAGAGSVKFED